MIELAYRPPDDSVKPKLPGKIRLLSFKNFCPYQIDLEYYKEMRNLFTIEEWIDVLLGAVDYNADGYESEDQKLMMLTRLLPFVEKRLNLIELASKGTGKSYVYGGISRYGWLSSGGIMSRAKLFYDISKSKDGLIAGYDFLTLDEVQTIIFPDPDEMKAALKGYLENGKYTVGSQKNVSSCGFVLSGNATIEAMEQRGATNIFQELPAVFHESALLERFHGFISGLDIPPMTEDLKICDWALNSEYFTSIMHELRDDSTYRMIVDQLMIVPEGVKTRDVEAVKRIATAYLKLLFPNVKKASDIDHWTFNRYCLQRATTMRGFILNQLGMLDKEYAGRYIPIFEING